MTDLSCGYPGDRDEALIAHLYGDGDAATRAAFGAHVAACARCREELASLGGVRAQLARWSPPSFAVTSHQSPVNSPQSAVRKPHWWREVPMWAQVAAALLFLGVSAGIANVDVRYDQSGLSLRTGWSQVRSSGSGGSNGSGGSTGSTGSSGSSGSSVAQGFSPANAPWRADLAALEGQLKSEFGASQAAAAASQATPVRTASALDPETLRRVRALLDESEKRQQRELALRVAEVMRDVNSARQADLRKIDRSLGLVQNSLGVEVMKQRESLNVLYRASQRQ